jgi:hypothetical protein
MKKYFNNPVSTSLIISALLLLASFSQNCFITASQDSQSIAVFLIGFMGLFFGTYAISWLANPFLILSWFLVLKRPKTALGLSLLSLGLALSFLNVTELMVNEGGSYEDISALAPGYWLWVGSISCAIAASLFSLKKQFLSTQKGTSIS